MQNRDLEQKLRSAVHKTAPDALDNILAACDAQRDTVIAMPPRRRRNMPARILAVAAMLAIVIGVSAGTGLLRFPGAEQPAAPVAGQVDSIIELDVNPSIELQVSRDERVLSATALNTDAEAILDGMDLQNATLDVAINALIGSMLKNGYISDLQNSILVTVENDDRARGEELQKRLADEIGALLSASSVEPAVLSQTVGTADETVQQMMDTYGISQGKASLIIGIMAQNPQLLERNLVGLSINELNLLAASGSGATGVSSTGTASDKAYIGEQKARELALAAAGVAEADTTWLNVELDADDGRMVYEVEFGTASAEYEIDLDARTGEIVKNESEYYHTPVNPVTPSGTEGSSNGDIGRDAALATALAHAGLAEADVYSVKIEFDYDDGRGKYDVEFESGRTEYEYEIDAATGDILDVDIDWDD